MDKDAFDNFMNRRYNPALQQYKERAFHNQQMYKRLQWYMIILSMVTAILIGSQQFFDWIPIKLLALITSVIVSGLATSLKTFSFQEKWSFYNKMGSDLENEFDMYTAINDVYSKASDKESLFVMRVRTIINEGANSMHNSTIPRFFRPSSGNTSSQT